MTPEGPKHVQVGCGDWDSGGRHEKLTNPTSVLRAWEAKVAGDCCPQAGCTQYHLLKLCSWVFLSHLATGLGCSEWDGRVGLWPTSGDPSVRGQPRGTDREGAGAHTPRLMGHLRARAGCR